MMRKIKIFEDFMGDLFGLPVFSEWDDEEDRLFNDMSFEILKSFQGDNFEMDEPSRSYKDFERTKDIRCDYWLTIGTIKKLKILTNNEIEVLNNTFPPGIRTYTYKDWEGNQKIKGYETFPIFGNFYWYSIPLEPYPRREERIWLIAKDREGYFRVAHGKERDLRDIWEGAKKWKNLEDLVKSETHTLQKIGKEFEDHLDNYREEWRYENRENLREEDY